MTAPPGNEWMCQHCRKRPVIERGATTCDRCAEQPEPQQDSADDRHVEAIATAKGLLKESGKVFMNSVNGEIKAVALALQGILTVQIELLESQPDMGEYSFALPEQGPEPQMGPQPWQ